MRKKLSCWFGRHIWATRVEQGETYTVCGACGRSPRGSKPPVSEADLEYMKTTGQSDNSISSGF